MPLIDGTYEILRQQALSERETLVQATDPDGRPVRIVWYDVPPDQEASFERHRRTLRRLAREGETLLRDVVSRPGAHYSVWEDPADAPAVEDDPAWTDRLAALGLPLEDALLRRDGRRATLGMLRWNLAPAEGPAGTAPGTGTPPFPPPRRAVPAREGAGRGTATDETAERGRRRWLPGGGSFAPTPRVRTWTLSATLTLAAIALGLIGWDRRDNDALVTVPVVADTPAQEAADRLAALGLNVVPQARADGEAAGEALATVPAAGTMLRPGREVQLLYARPPAGMATQEVPTLVGRSLGPDIEARLREADLRTGPIARVPADQPAGTVLAQRPAAGTHLAREGAVSLLVSDGPRPALTFLPDLQGLEEEDARALARVAGLPAERVLSDRVEAADAEPGTVVAMTPAPWTPLRLEDVTLRLLIADPGSGTDPGAGGDGAPDLVGLPREAATLAARDAGLEVSVARLADPRLPAGVVLQDPPPGAVVDDVLRLVVNVRPVALPVPEPEARILTPVPREVPYRFLIEPGIPAQTVEVRATTADGRTRRVDLTRAAGGDTVEGLWRTSTPGPVRFEVYLNGEFYAASRVSP